MKILKKTLFGLILFLAAPSIALSAGGFGKILSENTDVYAIYISMTADGAGAFTAVEITDVGGSLTGVYIDEGSTPTDGTINVSVLLDDTDIDLLGANGTDVSTSTGYATIVPASTVTGDAYLADFVGDVSIQITANGTALANPVVVCTFRK